MSEFMSVPAGTFLILPPALWKNLYDVLVFTNITVNVGLAAP